MRDRGRERGEYRQMDGERGLEERELDTDKAEPEKEIRGRKIFKYVCLRAGKTILCLHVCVCLREDKEIKKEKEKEKLL